MIPQYSMVRLITDKYASEGAPRGSIGAVIEVWGDGWYEVECSDSEGITYAMITAHEQELLVEPAVALLGVEHRADVELVRIVIAIDGVRHTFDMLVRTARFGELEALTVTPAPGVWERFASAPPWLPAALDHIACAAAAGRRLVFPQPLAEGVRELRCERPEP